jgi:DEAD/DEAH box helicase domain-containing protein
MIDPIGVHRDIKNNFKAYLKTRFKTRYDSLEVKRMNHYEKDKVISRLPFIEFIPQYKVKTDVNGNPLKISGLSHDNFGNYFGQNDIPLNFFKDLVAGGLFPHELYTHQYEMLINSTRGSDGISKDSIITSGTGSGKTESFLLPLFASLARESVNWNTPGYNGQQWWENNQINANSWQFQRSGENRKAAMRAMILYPMNALVEDQLSRLRKAIDSDPVRNILNTYLNGNKIFFGRYNSAAPNNKDVVPRTQQPGESQTDYDKYLESIAYNLRDLQAYAKNINSTQQKVEQYVNEQGGDLHESRKNYPRTGGAEMHFRQDMQEYPPDIFITNFSMLNIILMRGKEDGIFEKTKDWLREKRDNIFHLIIDELHLYRGSSGTEVAYLISLLLERLGFGKDVGWSQLRILASSASLETNTEPGKTDTEKYLKEFFNKESGDESNFKIFSHETRPIEEIFEGFSGSDANAFCQLSDLADSTDFIKRVLRFEALDNEIIQQLKTIAESLSCENQPGEDVVKKLTEHFNTRCFSRALVDAYGNCGDRPLSADVLAESLFVGLQVDRMQALRGLLILRGLFDVTRIETNAPKLRIHLFFRNVEGIWSSVHSDDLTTPSDKLFQEPLLKDLGGNKVLELLYCEKCGTTMWGGKRMDIISSSDENTISEHDANSPEGLIEIIGNDSNLEDLPEKGGFKMLESRTYDEYAVFWPEITGHPFNSSIGFQNNRFWQPGKSEAFLKRRNGFWKNAWLNKRSGKVLLLQPQDEQHFVKGRLLVCYSGQTADEIGDILSSSHESAKEISALPSVCPCCGEDRSPKQNNSTSGDTQKAKSPIRGFRTGFSKVSQIFAKELLTQLKYSQNSFEGKIVSFSDSREDAAQIANGIEREHYDDLMRELIYY